MNSMKWEFECKRWTENEFEGRKWKEFDERRININKEETMENECNDCQTMKESNRNTMKMKIKIERGKVGMNWKTEV